MKRQWDALALVFASAVVVGAAYVAVVALGGPVWALLGVLACLGVLLALAWWIDRER